MQRQQYQLIEQHVEGKRPDVVCEDVVGVLDEFVVLLDGVTGKDGATYRGTSGGRFAADVVLAKLAELDGRVDARTALDAVSEALRDATYDEAGSVAHPPGTQMAVYSPARGELWRVGDVHTRIGEIVLPTPAPPTDEIATSFRAALLYALLEEGRSVEELKQSDPSWEAILPLLSRQDVFANRTDHHLGYGVVNGSAVPEQHLQVHNVPPGVELVMASDGYFSAEGTLAQAEAELHAVLQRDPLLIRLFQGFRPAPEGGSFDDRAWVRLQTFA